MCRLLWPGKADQIILSRKILAKLTEKPPKIGILDQQNLWMSNTNLHLNLADKILKFGGGAVDELENAEMRS